MNEPPIDTEVVTPRRRVLRDENFVRIERLAEILDEGVVVPGLSVRVPLDPVIGLIPGFGDAVTTALALTILAKAREEGLPKHVQLRMAANTAIDFVVGAIPVLGDVFDFFYKSNRKNMRLLKKYLEPTIKAEEVE